MDMWVEILALHIMREGHWYRGEVRRIERATGEAWVAEGIVREVDDPSQRPDLPRLQILLQPEDGEITVESTEN